MHENLKEVALQFVMHRYTDDCTFDEMFGDDELILPLPLLRAFDSYQIGLTTYEEFEEQVDMAFVDLIVGNIPSGIKITFDTVGKE